MKTTGCLAAALSAAAIALSACGDSTGSAVASGSLAFGYTGARSGSYSATGSFRRTSDSTFARQPFAVGARGTESGVSFVSLLAYQPVSTTTGDLVLFLLPNVTGPTTLDLSPGCAAAECPLAAIVFDTDSQASQDESEFYAFESGTLEVTSVSGGRMRGTFSGKATQFLGGESVTVAGGTFDVPLVSQGFLGASRAVATPLRATPR